jgi:dipeptidyl aminopeptidase/acylaminoacyl peptidase
MKNRVLLTLSVVCSTALAAPPASGEPQKAAIHAPKAPVPLADYFKILFTRGASFNHDETLVAYLSNEGGRLDVWAANVTTSERKQLTHVKGFVQTFRFSPTADQLAFTADVGGDELMALYLTDSKGKEPEALFPDDPKGTRTDFADWAQDGKTFLYLSSRRDPKYQDLYEYDLKTKKSTELWEASGALSYALTSRDHKQFLLVETLNDANTNVWLVKRGENKQTLLTPHTSDVIFSPLDISPDDKTISMSTDMGTEFQTGATYDIAKKTITVQSDAAWDLEDASWSKTGKYFYTVRNADGAPELVLTDAKTKKVVPLPKLTAPGPLVPIAFSKSDRYLAARLQTDIAPTVTWVIDLKEGKGHQLLDQLPDSLRDRPFAPGQSVKVKSFDGKDVPAFLYSPPGNGPFPSLISVHGGPTGQSLRDFSLFTQYMVTKGYAVLVPNVRGSTGYGKSWTKLDNKDLGGGPLKDVIACKQWLIANAHADPKKVTIMGGSYGGYMTLAAATFTPKEFAAHVDIFGVSDLKTLVESFPAYWQSQATYIYQKFGDPKDPNDAKYQHDRSPIFFVDKIERPLLVIQGTNDARVKKDQSDRIVEALKKRNVPVDYLVIDGEGHGFSKNENRQLAYETADRFLDKYIFGDTEVKVLAK